MPAELYGSDYILDASALLAHLNEEPGTGAVERALAGDAVSSAVNLGEVLSKAIETGVSSKRLETEPG